MIGLPTLYVLNGLFFAAVAVINAFDGDNPRRFRSAGFWGLNAVILIFGGLMSAFLAGCLVLASVVLAAFGGLGQSQRPTHASQERRHGAARFGYRLFIPALTVPLVTVIGTVAFRYVYIGGQPLIDTDHTTLIALGCGVLVALAVALIMLRQRPEISLTEGRRLLDTIGWAAVLPQMLAALGGLFAAAGVGETVANLITGVVPMTAPGVVTATYCIGMALFTVIMGNAFAAFPVMTAGIGLPFIVHDLHGNPAIMAAIGMLSGFCGTLATPMAANFNIVPAALLELPDQNAVIKVQLPTALILLIANILLMNLLVFRY
ncbi:DUF979 domain-containing protein [Salinisphaera sp. SPP-AMP-43]|uniref:DUF979 domain-containing protein n=1 Tax=Salinisphaera sp. SPP-AMP-43 TaxID=3121288 RepID=UPI003C6E6857